MIGSHSLADENTEQKQLAGRNTSESNIVKHKQRNKINFLGKVSLHFQMVHKLHNSIISWAFLCGFGWEVLAEWGQYPLSDQQEFQCSGEYDRRRCQILDTSYWRMPDTFNRIAALHAWNWKVISCSCLISAGCGGQYSREVWSDTEDGRCWVTTRITSSSTDRRSCQTLNTFYWSSDKIILRAVCQRQP